MRCTSAAPGMRLPIYTTLDSTSTRKCQTTPQLRATSQCRPVRATQRLVRQVLPLHTRPRAHGMRALAICLTTCQIRFSTRLRSHSPLRSKV